MATPSVGVLDVMVNIRVTRSRGVIGIAAVEVWKTVRGRCDSTGFSWGNMNHGANDSHARTYEHAL
jgi:hypothetical protein